MSGCGGGPVLLPDYMGGELHLFPVGLIVGGRRNIPGETDDTDVVEIRRIKAIQPDGVAGGHWWQLCDKERFHGVGA